MGKKKPKVFTVHGLRMFRLETVNGHVVRIPIAVPPKDGPEGPWYVSWEVIDVSRPRARRDRSASGAADGEEKVHALLNAAQRLVHLAKLELAAWEARNRTTTHPRCESFAAARRRAQAPRPKRKP